MPSPIKNRKTEESYNVGDFADMMQSYAASIDEFAPVGKSSGSFSYIGRTFENIDTNISVRSEYNRADYDYLRKSEAVPHTIEGLFKMCIRAYKKVALVRSVIDMMADFTVAGIRIVHPNKKIENFYKNWAKTVGLYEVSERIANMLYVTANCPIKIRYGKVPIKVEDEWRKNYAAEDATIEDVKVYKRNIPLAYHVLDPRTIEVIGGELSAFVGRPVYGLKLGFHFKTMYDKIERMSYKNQDILEMVKLIPDQIKIALKEGHRVVPFEPSKFTMLYYKKHDWEIWASPLLESILSNLILMEKMHLADSSALDGAISQIRLWKLGIYNESNPAQSILPGPAAFAKLRSILANVGNGVLDLVWGPEIDFKESSSQVHNYLDPKKYQHVMESIYQGLGVPATLTGSSTGGNSGLTNNAISMKTLIERLEYGRSIITSFWDKQIKLVQKAMGWRFPAKIVFDYQVLSDTDVGKQIMIDLFDRNVISQETLHEVLGRDTEIETVRISREQKKLVDGTMPPKAGPYHNAEKDHDMRKLLLQNGGVTPSELGMRLDERKKGEETKNDQMERIQMQTTKMQIQNQRMMNKERVVVQKMKKKSPGGDGRPKNSKDKKARKQRTPKPAKAEFANIFLWAVDAQKELTDVLTPVFLNHFNKKNMRSLTKAETHQAEVLKFKLLCQLQPFSEVNQKVVYNLVQNQNNVSEEIVKQLKALSIVFSNKHDREPTLEEMRQMQACAYALANES